MSNAVVRLLLCNLNWPALAMFDEENPAIHIMGVLSQLGLRRWDPVRVDGHLLANPPLLRVLQPPTQLSSSVTTLVTQSPSHIWRHCLSHHPGHQKAPSNKQLRTRIGKKSIATKFIASLILPSWSSAKGMVAYLKVKTFSNTCIPLSLAIGPTQFNLL